MSVADEDRRVKLIDTGTDPQIVISNRRSGHPATLYEVYISLRAVQIAFYRMGVVAQDTIKGIKNASVFDAFDLKSL